MKAPKIVEDVLDKPGRYTFVGTIWAWQFEVDDQGQVHQINPMTNERDGVLEPDGWTEHSHSSHNIVVLLECKKDEHVWDGPEVEFDEGRGQSVTCSKCGMWAVNFSLKYGP